MIKTPSNTFNIAEKNWLGFAGVHIILVNYKVLVLARTTSVLKSASNKCNITILLFKNVPVLQKKCIIL